MPSITIRVTVPAILDLFLPERILVLIFKLHVLLRNTLLSPHRIEL